MGTRAVIRFNNKPILATHWDGDPEALGRDLEKVKTVTDILGVGKKHVVDAASESVIEILNKGRYKHIASKTNGKYTAKDIEKLHKVGECITFIVMSKDDYSISSIKHYNDFAEFEYNVTKNGVMYRKLHGEYPESLKTAGKFKHLPKKVSIGKTT